MEFVNQRNNSLDSSSFHRRCSKNKEMWQACCITKKIEKINRKQMSAADWRWCEFEENEERDARWRTADTSGNTDFSSILICECIKWNMWLLYFVTFRRFESLICAPSKKQTQIYNFFIIVRHETIVSLFHLYLTNCILGTEKFYYSNLCIQKKSK